MQNLIPSATVGAITISCAATVRLRAIFIAWVRAFISGWGASAMVVESRESWTHVVVRIRQRYLLSTVTLAFLHPALPSSSWNL